MNEAGLLGVESRSYSGCFCRSCNTVDIFILNRKRNCAYAYRGSIPYY